jgi:hypothetical protein
MHLVHPLKKGEVATEPQNRDTRMSKNDVVPGTDGLAQTSPPRRPAQYYFIEDGIAGRRDADSADDEIPFETSALNNQRQHLLK